MLTPGASSGDSSYGPKGRERQSDRQAIGVLSQHGTQVSVRGNPFHPVNLNYLFKSFR